VFESITADREFFGRKYENRDTKVATRWGWMGAMIVGIDEGM
jgi:hypothetical protein